MKKKFLKFEFATYEWQVIKGSCCMLILVQCAVLDRGTSKGRQLLQDNTGHQYTRTGRPNKTGVTYWRCVIRNKHNYCRATIIQRDGTYTRGLHQHSHAPKAGHLTTRVITLKVCSEWCKRKILISSSYSVDMTPLCESELSVMSA